MCKFGWPVLLAFAFCACPLRAQTIFWSSPANAVNLTGAGTGTSLPMDQGFRFELGVFSDGFVPTADRMSDWADNWNPMQRVLYDPSTKRYASAYTPQTNDAPFTIGKPVYVWGFSSKGSSAEWILFRSPAWLMPDANPQPFSSNNYVWYANAQGVTAVIGTINRSGSPFLMQSAPVQGVLSPATTWDQWRAENLAGVIANHPSEDADGDGLSNVLEFAFGQNPRQPGKLPVMPITLEQVGGERFLQMEVPRRKDHRAVVAVQVSSDLAHWQEGAPHVEIISDSSAAVIVRDRTPQSVANGRRFMRVKVATAQP